MPCASCMAGWQDRLCLPGSVYGDQKRCQGRRPPQYDRGYEGSLKAWVLRIVANESINLLRKQSRFTSVNALPDLPEEGEPDIPPVPPDQLNEMIGKLPAGYRAVLNLYVFEKKSHKEIAQMLGIKENSSASQFLRAKRMLAKMIEDYKRHNHDE